MVAHTTALTPREWQVLELVAQGMQLGEVADVLCISYHTVRNHTRSIRLRLGGATPAHCVYLAMVVQASTNSA